MVSSEDTTRSCNQGIVVGPGSCTESGNGLSASGLHPVPTPCSNMTDGKQNSAC